MVFLTGMEEGVFPHSRSMNDADELEEERRLCYVGITRAKQRLFLSYALHRRIQGYGVGEPSRFLLEIPESELTMLNAARAAAARAAPTAVAPPDSARTSRSASAPSCATPAMARGFSSACSARGAT